MQYIFPLQFECVNNASSIFLLQLFASVKRMMTTLNSTVMATIVHNATRSPRPVLLPYQPAYHTALIILSVLAFGHNLLVLVVYNKDKSLHTQTNFILSNLACCDLITGCIFLPLMTASSFVRSRQLRFATNVFADITVIGIVLSLTAVTYERYLNLCHPYKYPMIVTKTRVRLLVVFIWSVAIIFSLIPIAWSLSIFGHGSLHPTESFTTAYQVHSLVVLVIFFIIPTLVSLFALISMYCVIRKLTKNDFMISVQNRRKRERRVVVVFLAMYMCLITCWTPLNVVRIAIDFRLPFRWQRWLLEFFVCLRGLPSFLNPLIYIWCKQDFRRSVIKLNAFRSDEVSARRSENQTKILMESFKQAE